jgi:hypothetical protein
MMKWNGLGKKWSWPNRGTVPALSGRIKYNHEELQSGKPESRPRLEPDTYRIQVRSVTAKPIPQSDSIET